MYRALLHASFVFSLNQRPFGSGEWYAKKQEMLAFFMDTVTADDDIFLAYADRIAGDFGRTLSSPEDRAALFDSLAELPSFEKKGVATKMMRWFSVNQMWLSILQDTACSGGFR